MAVNLEPELHKEGGLASPPQEIAPTRRYGLYEIGLWAKRHPTIRGLVAIADVIAKLAIFYTVLVYLAEGHQRQKTRDFQAWQVLNTARAGDGGRKLALYDLTSDGVDLGDIDLSYANLSRASMRGALMQGANLKGVNLTHADLSCRSGTQWTLPWYIHCRTKTDLAFADLSNAMLLGINVSNAQFVSTNFGDRLNAQSADFTQAFISAVDLKSAYFLKSRLDGAVFLEDKFGTLNLINTSAIGTKFIDVQIELLYLITTVNRIGCATTEACADNSLQANLLSNLTRAEFRNVYVGGHPISETDLRGAILCQTMIETRISNRDCNIEQAKRAIPIRLDDDSQR